MAGQPNPAPQNNDRDFEVTFADLAHAQLQDKAPALLDYLLGFQVIESNDEKTFGIGVLGFKVGEQLLYAPSFFMNGELKQPMMYIKDSNMFVPLQDNWITYLLSRRTQAMGQFTPQSESQLGVFSPNFSSGSGAGPLFSVRSASEKNAAWTIFGMDRPHKTLDLPTFLKKSAAFDTARVLLEAVKTDQQLAEAVFKFYKLAQLMPDRVAPKPQLHKPAGFKAPVTRRSILAEDPAQLFNKSGAHRVKILYGMVNDPTRSDSDKERLMAGEVLFKDARESTNVAYRTSEPCKLMNPTETGCYELLVAGGEYRKVFIFIAPRPVGRGFVKICMVTDPESGGFLYQWVENLWVKPRTTSREDDRKTLEGKMKELKSVSKDSVYCIVNKKDMRGTVAFKVDKSVTGENGDISLSVMPMISCLPDKPLGTTKHTNADAGPRSYGDRPFVTGNGSSSNKPHEDYGSMRHIVLTKQPESSFVMTGDTLFASKEYCGFLDLDPEKNIAGDTGTTWLGHDPASLAEVEVGLMKHGAEQLVLWRDGKCHYVNGKGPFNKLAVLEALVKKAGLRGDEAVQMLSELQNKAPTKFLIKNAVGYAPPFPEAPMGYDDYAGVPVQTPMTQELQMNMYNPPPINYLDKMYRQNLTQSAQQGHKDVFDTAAIASLVHSADNDDLITTYVGDMLKGLDRVCRVLLLFYWKNDKFRDRYGRENIPEIESQLKTAVKSLGDLILTMKQRQVKGTPASDALTLPMNEEDSVA